MSDNRRRSGNEPGRDCPTEVTFRQFMALVNSGLTILRVQGKIEDATKAKGRLVRFNRSVRIKPDTFAYNADGDPYVVAQRIRWDWRSGCFVDLLREDGTPWEHTLTWSQLDYITWQACGDPNGTWIKVTTRF